jgi:hypothetical protein
VRGDTDARPRFVASVELARVKRILRGMGWLDQVKAREVLEEAFCGADENYGIQAAIDLGKDLDWPPGPGGTERDDARLRAAGFDVSSNKYSHSTITK